MIEDFYTDLDIYEDVEVDWDNPPDNDNGSLLFKDTMQGFIQTRGGSRNFRNQALAPNSTHILYCDITNDIVVGDYIKFLDEFYLIEYIPPLNGISGMDDHQECDLVFQNNIGDL